MTTSSALATAEPLNVARPPEQRTPNADTICPLPVRSDTVADPPAPAPESFGAINHDRRSTVPVRDPAHRSYRPKAEPEPECDRLLTVSGVLAWTDHETDGRFTTTHQTEADAALWVARKVLAGGILDWSIGGRRRVAVAVPGPGSLRYRLSDGRRIVVPYDLTHGAPVVVDLWTDPDGNVRGGTLDSSPAEVRTAWRAWWSSTATLPILPERQCCGGL